MKLFAIKLKSQFPKSEIQKHQQDEGNIFLKLQ